MFVDRARGGVIVDVDGNSLIDLGAGIAEVNVGNAAPKVVEAVQKQVASPQCRAQLDRPHPHAPRSGWR